MPKKSTQPTIIYANPADRYNGWSAMANADGTWTVYDEKSKVKHRGSSRNQNAAASDAIRWLRSKGKMS